VDLRRPFSILNPPISPESACISPLKEPDSALIIPVKWRFPSSSA
jgi:hypothetical protein